MDTPILEQRRMPEPDLTVTALALGTAPLGGMYAPVGLSVGEATVNKALNIGIRYFDTAPMYGMGKAEHVLGHALRMVEESTNVDIVVSTKIGRLLVSPRPGRNRAELPPKNDFDSGWQGALPFEEVFDYGYDAVMRSFDDSQQRFGSRHIDILYVHDIGHATHGARHDHHWTALTAGGGFRALSELRDAGLVKAVGVAVNEWEAIRASLDYFPLDCCLLAGRYTLLEQTALSPFLSLCAQHRLSVVIGGAFNSGVLVAHEGGHLKYNYDTVPSTVLATVERIRAVCERFGIPVPAAALQFPLAHPSVVSLLVGARSPAEVEQALLWLHAPIPGELWEVLKQERLIEDEAPLPVAVTG